MNILPFQVNVPAEITLERPEGTLVQGRYGDRVMFTLADGRIMYVPPFVASKIQADGVAPGDRFQLCKTQVRNGINGGVIIDHEAPRRGHFVAVEK
jgi:hypothetical protein